MMAYLWTTDIYFLWRIVSLDFLFCSCVSSGGDTTSVNSSSPLKYSFHRLLALWLVVYVQVRVCLAAQQPVMAMPL